VKEIATSNQLSWWRGRLQERGADAAALACVALFFVAFFAPTLFAGKFLVAGDAYFYSYPLRSIEWDMIRRGVLPLWTPHVLAGYPLLSMSQLGLGYPLTWTHLLLPDHFAEEIYVLVPFLLAPAFTYAFARETGRSPLAALLAALAFTYGGMMTSRLGVTGLRTNGVMWLPLLLIAIERARNSRFAACLLAATAAYTMSVLNGDGQCFVYVGLLAAAYALIDPARALFNARREGSHSLAEGSRSLADTRRERWRALRSWETWRPFAVALGAIMLAAGVAAYQIFETLRAARRSVRAALGYAVFSEGAFSMSESLRSLVAPPYHLIEVTTYVAPLALALAVVGSLVSWRRRDARGVFWIIIACLSFVLMLGEATPLNRLVYHLPVLNRFRYPSRHTFEWSFSVAMLAARGFDALTVAHAPRVLRWHMLSLRAFGSRARGLAVGWLLVASCALTGFLWWRDAMRRTPQPLTGLDMGLIPAQPEASYLVWKLAFTLLAALALLVALAAQRGARADAARDAATNAATETRGVSTWSLRARAALLACALGLACLVEPFILCSHIWFPFARSAAEFAEVPHAIRLLQSSPPEQHRVYTRVNLFVVGYPRRPPLDLPNVTALRGLQNVAGYEQFVLERFSRALGNVGADAVNPRYDVRGSPDATLFAPSSRVLDLLNTSFVVTFAHLSTAYEPPNDQSAATTSDGKTETNDDNVSAGDTGKVNHVALPPTLDASRWRLIYASDGVWVLQNLRAQPRAWLVGEVASVDGEEALRRIRGEHGEDVPFDPQRTALVEDAPEELPRLAGGALASESFARIVAYEPSRLVVETNAERDSLLVVSEIFYPGWEANVDGRAERIRLTDYLLRGVSLPAGRHRVEMRYTAPAARNGAIISALTLLTLACLGVYTFRTRGRGASASVNEARARTEEARARA
jgi:hypothetical protein